MLAKSPESAHKKLQYFSSYRVNVDACKLILMIPDLINSQIRQGQHY